MKENDLPYFAKIINVGNSFGITFDKKIRERIKLERGIDLETGDYITILIGDIQKKKE